MIIRPIFSPARAHFLADFPHAFAGDLLGNVRDEHRRLGGARARLMRLAFWIDIVLVV